MHIEVLNMVSVGAPLTKWMPSVGMQRMGKTSPFQKGGICKGERRFLSSTKPLMCNSSPKDDEKVLSEG